ncbi:MAG TPA: hypothetical protein VFQ45_21180 [Longimicrobium sp.]|nr:hypothetical protein [Longimicrobium sp.]
MDLWTSGRETDWRRALDSHEAVIAAQGVKALPELDRWYREDFPAAVAAREPAHITHDEMVRVTEWKMARGIWRARNLALVRGNAPDAVVRASTRALAAIPDPKTPIAELATLAGVGPATASAVAAAAAPEHYPFFDELVGAQVPGLGKVDFTPAYYARYAAALRDRARTLGGSWTPARVEQALWAHAGGKAGARGNR